MVTRWTYDDKSRQQLMRRERMKGREEVVAEILEYLNDQSKQLGPTDLLEVRRWIWILFGTDKHGVKP